MVNVAAARRLMIDSQLRTFDVSDRVVLAAFDAVPREGFVAPADRPLAYGDARLSCGAESERALLVPMMLARLLQAAEIRAGERALVVAGGLGYSAALLDAMGATVTLLEDSAALAAAAGQALAGGASKVDVVSGPLPAGWAQGAPYDVILVEGAVTAGLDGLKSQLAENGRLHTIQRESRRDRAMLYLKSNGTVSARPLFEASAAPLRVFESTPEFVF